MPRMPRGIPTWLLILLQPLTAAAAADLQPGPRAPILGPTSRHFYDPDWPTVRTVLLNKCVKCHRQGTDQVDLTTHASLLTAGDDEEPLVIPGDVEGSSLYEQVVWNVHEDSDSDLEDEPSMPPEKTEWLTAGQLAAMRRWILNGAQQYAAGYTKETVPTTELDFPSAKTCATCHPRQYSEWSRSMHAYAQHSPVFDAFNRTLAERTSGTIGTFCARCHTPIGTAMGEHETMPNICRTRISMEGVTCIVCHRRGTAHYKNNGRLPIEPGELNEGCMYGPFESSFAESVGSHPSRRNPYIKTSQFCGECHDVIAPNGLRNEEAFSEWQHSPAALKGITCQQCHMGPVQGLPTADCQRPLGRSASVPGIDDDELPLRHITDHTFAGPDYSMLPDTEFPHVLDWMYETDYRNESRLTQHQQSTLRTLRLRNRAHLKKAREKRLELMHNAARLHVSHPASATAGQRIKIRADVRSLVAGHNFPTGFSAERQLWVAVSVCAPNGSVVFSSGHMDHNGDLRDEHSREVLLGHIPHDRFLCNFQNQFTALTNKGTERTVVISVNRHQLPVSILRPATTPVTSFGRPPDFRIAKGSIPPLKTLGQTYPVRMPDCGGNYTVTVRLLFRHLPPTLLDHIGTPHLKSQLEIIVLDNYHGLISVSGT